MTCPSCLALHGMAHNFIELDKAVVHVIRLISFLWLWFLILLFSNLCYYSDPSYLYFSYYIYIYFFFLFLFLLSLCCWSLVLPLRGCYLLVFIIVLLFFNLSLFFLIFFLSFSPWPSSWWIPDHPITCSTLWAPALPRAGKPFPDCCRVMAAQMEGSGSQEPLSPLSQLVTPAHLFLFPAWGRSQSTSCPGLKRRQRRGRQKTGKCPGGRGQELTPARGCRAQRTSDEGDLRSLWCWNKTTLGLPWWSSG